jgi:biopolymer transport protein ExbD
MRRIGRILLAALIVALTGVGAMARQQISMLDDKAIIISIPSEGESYVGNERLSVKGIVERVRERLKGRPPAEQTVYIKASRDVSYGHIVSIIDQLREAGIERIGLVAENSKPTPRDDDRTARPQDQPPAPPARQQPPNEANTETPLVVKVTLTTKGQLRIKVNERLVRLADLESAVRRQLADRHDKTVFLLAPMRIRYERVVSIVDALKGAGASPIGLQLDYLQ